MNKIQKICVYCGSSLGNDPLYKEAAQTIGKMMAHHDIGLVYGGGSKGIMGTIAQAVKTSGGKVTGIIPSFLMSKEAPDSPADSQNNQLDELIITKTMHERKTIMFEHSDAFIALPGGIGTLEEIVEIMTWAQLGQHQKPIAFANIKQFWAPMTSLIDHMTQEGFLHTRQNLNPLIINEAEDVIPAIIKAAKP